MDIKTMILMLALGNLTLAVALGLFEYSARKSFSLSTWPYSKFIQGLAWCCFYQRGDLAEFISILLANTLLFVGITLEAGAMWEAGEYTEWRRYLLPPLTIGIGLFVGVYVTGQSSNMLVAIASLIASLLYAVAGFALLKAWRGASVLTRFVAVSTLLLAFVIAMRAAWAWLSADEVHLLSASWVQHLTFGSMYLLMMINGFGFLLIMREKQELELQRLAIVDPLTEAPNRRGFYNALLPWVALARRPGQSTAIIMLDLDHFKRVNDTYGHQVGDVVLKAVVEVGQKQLRDSDVLGRLGGEEFAVILPRTNLPDAMQVAERIRLAIANMPIKTERALIYVTASMGVTLIRADDSTVSLFNRADQALYAAKQAGRNTVREALAVEPMLV